MEQHQQVGGLPPLFAVNSADAQPSAVANPTPTQPQLPPTHPSYAEMITAAIMWDSSQGKAEGSSKRAIAKYIDRVYTNLPPTHSALLTHHLKRLKNSGQLVMIKNSYQLPVVAAAAAAASGAAAVPLRSAPPSQLNPQPQDSTTPKKRPGRPPKAKPLGHPSPGSVGPSPAPAAGVGNGPSTGKRPRGRPPRQQQQQQPAVAEVPFVQPVYDAPQPEVGLNNGHSVKRRPGRPFKNKPAQQPIYQAQAEFQPAKQELSIVPVNGTVSGVPKKRPGRPPKAKGAAAPGIAAPGIAAVGSGTGKPRGRPKRSALAPVAKPVGKRPRGRPPRQAGVAPGSGVAGGKRRGRPPRGSVPSVAPPKPARKYTGKPRGRPRKNASPVGKQTSEQVAANKELMKKVENMQATIKDAVVVLRPFVPNEDGADALAALQQLEHLSTMSLTGSPSPTPEEPPMTTTFVNSTVQVQPGTSVPETENIAVSTMVPPVVPFSIAEPTMNETAPLYGQPPTIEAQQPVSWIPSSEAQL
ncbi:uncharacterized protein LOC110721398 [Chenopodium quinoa]|uniref:uncharacterized protein LOC110721398 n=1 Tax=Chenopodium quinoa TaxID=63459 RepID=UPI000B77281A|nr:uncharacterized protein LOC110721398 [Chenopodium quinoa]